MKISSSLLLIASLTLSLLATAASPLAMPEFEQTPESKTIEQLELEIFKMNRALGANPAVLFNANHKALVYKEWSALLGSTLVLEPASKEEAIQKVQFLASLFVQGYNLNVTGSDAKAHEAIGFCLQISPDSAHCKLLSAMFYMSADKNELDNVKKTLLDLQAQFGKLKNEDVEIALGYFYVYAEDFDNALIQIDIVETHFADLSRDSVKKYRLIQLKEMKAAILEKRAKMKQASKIEQEK